MHSESLVHELYFDYWNFSEGALEESLEVIEADLKKQI